MTAGRLLCTGLMGTKLAAGTSAWRGACRVAGGNAFWLGTRLIAGRTFVSGDCNLREDSVAEKVLDGFLGVTPAARIFGLV